MVSGGQTHKHESMLLSSQTTTGVRVMASGYDPAGCQSTMAASQHVIAEFVSLLMSSNVPPERSVRSATPLDVVDSMGTSRRRSEWRHSPHPRWPTHHHCATAGTWCSDGSALRLLEMGKPGNDCGGTESQVRRPSAGKGWRSQATNNQVS